MSSLLSTGKKKAKASRVFGGELFDDVGDTSLWYSPSPKAAKAKNTKAQSEPTEDHPVVALFSETKQTPKDDKENCPNNDTLETGTEKNTSFQTLRDAELSRLRAMRTPEHRLRVEKTEAAVRMATMEHQSTQKPAAVKSQTLTKPPVSKFRTLNACRVAKKAVIVDKGRQVKSVRFQWDEDKKDAKKFYNRMEENRRQIMAMQRQIASTHFQEKARKQETQRLQHIAELDKESQFNSEVFREHQQKLKDERDRNRKKSMDARAKQRHYRKEGEEKMEATKREEEAIIFEVRSDLHRARREAKQEDALRRRMSFQFRAGDARRIRMMRSEWRQEEQSRNEQSAELDRAAASDVDAYKKQLEKERRESLQGRNRDARRRKMKEQSDTEAAINAEHESFELNWAGEKDVEAYEERTREERRKSLAARNKESLRHAQVMQELRSLNLEKETESFMLKFAADNDAKAYINRLAEERRQSLQLRGREARRQREYDDEQRQKATSEAIQEGLLQAECLSDVENYRKEVAAKMRKSLQFRGKESTMRRLDAENERRKVLSKEHQTFELDSLARLDVEEYLKECKQRRRKSLAFRAKESRRHAEWKLQQHSKDIERRHESAQLQALDYQCMALAEQHERARIAMDALRSAGCKIKGNPFVELLGNL